MRKIEITRKGPNFFFLSVIVILSLFTSIGVRAQYYPMPPSIPVSQLEKLKNLLDKSKSESAKIDILLRLSSLHYSKAIKSFSDFPIALKLAKEAKYKSIKTGNRNAIDKSLWAISTIYILQDSVGKAENILTEIVDPLIRNNVELGLAYTYIFCPERPLEDVLGKGKMYVQEALNLSLKLNNKKNELKSRQYLAFVHFLEGKEKECLKELKDVIGEYSADKIEGIQYPYGILADIHWSEGKYPEALQDLQIAISATEKSNDKTAMSDLYAGLAEIYLRASEYEKYISTLNLALDNSRQRISRYTAQNIIRSISRQLIKKHQGSAAIKYLNEQTRVFIPITYDQVIVMVNAYANAYLAIKDYKKAEQYFLKEFLMIKNAGWGTADNYSGMGYFYIEHKEYQKAKPFLVQAEKMQDKHTDVLVKRHLTYMLFLADSALGNYQSAIRYLKQNKKLDDSVENTKKRGDVQKLLIQFDTQKKENQIKDFKQRETVNHINQERSKLVKNIILSVAILFILVSIIIYRQYRQKKLLSEVITEKNLKQEALLIQLNRVVKEKEWLLKEVHHRVKNNLHTVMCLLESQAVYLESDALKAIEDSKHRIYAMSLIHQRLYETENSKSINMHSYIHEFVGYLRDSFVVENKIHFNVDVDQITLDVAVAIPLALVINEAVTNSIKHAFTGRMYGEISIFLKLANDQLNLKISDNGIGIKENRKNKRLGSLGMKLIDGLSEDLNGRVMVESDNGTAITFVCSIDPFMENAKNEN